MNLRDLYSETARQADQRVKIKGGIFDWLKRAKQKAKENPEFINATIGVYLDEKGTIATPDIVERTLKSLNKNQLFNYAPLRGVEELAPAWKDFVFSHFGGFNLEKIKSLSSLPFPFAGGLTKALNIVGRMFLEKGNTLLVPEERWENIDPVFSVNSGAAIEPFQDFDPDFTLDYLGEKLDKALEKNRKVALYLNYPSNPTGYSPTKEEAKELQSILADSCSKHPRSSLIVILDDAYEGYVHTDDALRHSLFPYLVDLHESLLPIKVDGVTKFVGCYGARLGFITFGLPGGTNASELDVMLDTLTKFSRCEVSNAPSFIQHVLVSVLKEHRQELERELSVLKDSLTKRFREFWRAIQAQGTSEVVKPVNFNSGFFGYFGIGGASADKFADALEKNGLGAVPFPDTNGIRITYASVPREKQARIAEILWDTARSFEL